MVNYLGLCSSSLTPGFAILFLLAGSNNGIIQHCRVTLLASNGLERSEGAVVQKICDLDFPGEVAILSKSSNNIHVYGLSSVNF